MLIFNKKLELSAYLQSVSNHSTTIGFVPTMGALHQGHLSLMQKSLSENSFTVVSIFVNPTQFNNPDDLAKYPRTLDQDIAKMEHISNDIIVFAPDVIDLYEGNTVASEFDFDGLEHQMEGKFRPGHFDGVGTIVKHLFEIVKPNRAYFGEKDFQQLQIIRKLVEKNNMPVEVIGCPIYREPNGLAMSSRNTRLSPEHQQQASVIYQILLSAKKLFGTENVKSVTDYVYDAFSKHPNFEIEYFEIANEETLEPAIAKEKAHKYRAFIAVFINNIRLIDTISLN